MNSHKILKILLIFGGVVEIVIGLLFMVLDFYLEQVGFEIIPIFTQMAGVFLFGYGILLIYSSRDVEKYAIIPLVNILIRIIMIVCGILSLLIYPEFFIILLIALPYDLLWSIFIFILLVKQGIILKKNNIEVKK